MGEHYVTIVVIILSQIKIEFEVDAYESVCVVELILCNLVKKKVHIV